VKLIVQPRDGADPIVAAIRGAKKSVDIAIFRFDHLAIEAALKEAAADKNVKVTALIAYANRGGEKTLRKLETRFLEAGITVARSANDLIRYHDKYLLIDGSALYLLSFNFTHLDIDRSRAFGVVSKDARWVQEARKLFEADCMRSPYVPGSDTFVVSPQNSRKVLGRFLKRARKQLLIYDPKISDKEMIGILEDRVRAGVEVRVIGTVARKSSVERRKLNGIRLHTRTIIRDRHQAFIGSQSLRESELDSRRELGLIIRNPACVRQLLETFESDWSEKVDARGPSRSKNAKLPKDDDKQSEAVVRVLRNELDPLPTKVKRAVRKVVSSAGSEVLNDKEIKSTVKKVVKKVVKQAVQAAVQEAR
jgi:cardiolipin synthase